MLPDFLIDKMPWIIVWIDNAFIFYKHSLIFFIVFFIYEWSSQTTHYSLSGLSLPIFIGIAAWLVYCAVRYGYAVG